MDAIAYHIGTYVSHTCGYVGISCYSDGYESIKNCGYIALAIIILIVAGIVVNSLKIKNQDNIPGLH